MSFIRLLLQSTIMLLLGAAIFLFHAPRVIHSRDDDAVVACYIERDSPILNDIPDGLCTHYQIIGQATIDNLGNFVPPLSNIARDFAKLRKWHKSKPNLLLTITGTNPTWSRLTSFDANMKKFARAVKRCLLKYELQGVDLDWEFPFWSGDGAIWDVEGFSSLIRILHETLSPHGLLVTAAVSGPPTVTRASYNVSALNEYLDLVFVMNYDFHVWNKMAPFVGFNAPLNPIWADRSELKEMNSAASMNTYLSRGLSKAKAVFGIPVYNLAYELANGYLHVPYSVATREVIGYTHHRDTCNLTQYYGWKEEWNEMAASPYLYNVEKKTWITSENERSVHAKASSARDGGFRGIMVFSLGTDDWTASCGKGKFPLTTTMKQALFNTAQ